jgi:hypothetical protein
MTWVAAAIVAAPILSNIAGSIISGQGSKTAAGQQVTGYNNATTAIDTNYEKAQNLLTNQYNTATNSLNTGYTNAEPQITSNYGMAIKGFAPYQAAGTSAANELKRLIDTGYASHQFNTQDLYNGLSPNYDFMLKQGQGETASLANMGGGMIGGNALRGLQKYTQDYASNAYQNAFSNYQNQRNSIFGNIQPVANMGLSATQSVGNLFARQGDALSGLSTGQGINLANLQTGYGNTGANLFANQGNAQGQLAIGSANATAQGTLGQYDQYGNAVANIPGSVVNGLLVSKLINPTASGGNLYSTPTVSPTGNNVVSPVAIA